MVTTEAQERTTISPVLEASAVALEDIADLLEGGQTGAPAMPTMAPNSSPVSQLITSLLMSRMGMDEATWPAEEPSLVDSPNPPAQDEDQNKPTS